MAYQADAYKLMKRLGVSLLHLDGNSNIFVKLQLPWQFLWMKSKVPKLESGQGSNTKPLDSESNALTIRSLQ